MKKSIKKIILVVLFLIVGSMGYSLQVYSDNAVITNGVVVFTTGSSTEDATSSSSTTENTRIDIYPKTGENIGQSLLIRSFGLALVVTVVVRKIFTKISK